MKIDVVVDFETKPIEEEPERFPPEPVGVSIKVGAKKSVYTRGTPRELGERLRPYWNSRRHRIVMHNGIGFDMAVGAKHCGLPIEPAGGIADTLPLLFLKHPHASTLSLKPSAEKFLGLPNDDQRELRDWIMANVPEAKARPKNWGAHIWRAPFELVKRYAEGDTDKTAALLDLFEPKLDEREREAWEREHRVAPCLIANGLRGVRLDASLVQRDAEVFSLKLAETNDAIRKALRAPSLDIDSHDLGRRIVAMGHPLPVNADGSYSTSKMSLRDSTLPDRVKGLLLYRSALAQALRTFTHPMARQSAATGGIMHTHWNQVRGSNKAGDGGARTGRQSSEPNLQNLPSPEKLEGLYAFLSKAMRVKPERVRDAFPLPTIRRYILPDEGCVIMGRDFSQQELRILAHFEGADLLEMYQKYPDLDLHTFVQEMIAEVTGVKLGRKIVKVLNFCTVYGGGAQAIADQGDLPLSEAQELQRLYFQALPTIRKTMNEAQGSRYVRTIGGRIYEPEAPKIIKGRLRQFNYKLLNYLIQGSAADQTKEAIARWWESRSGDSRFLLSVHDELVFSCDARAVRLEMGHLKAIMESTDVLKFEVPFLSEGYTGPNWADIEEYEDV